MKSVLLLVVLLLASTGCAFAGIGAGVGAAIPKTETELTTQPALVEHVDHEVAEVHEHKGNHWLTGFLIGGAIDLVAGAALTYMAVQSFGSGLSAMGGM